MRKLIFAVSGASGMPLASAVLGHIASVEELEIHLVLSPAAHLVMREEKGFVLEEATGRVAGVYTEDDLAAPPASGSWLFETMIICPCSANTLGAIAAGLGGTLLQRAAQVALKERRRLILAVRETPLSLIHLRCMQLATEAGAIVMPFIPAFYHGDDSMAGAMRQFAGHLLDIAGIPNELRKRWKE